MPELLSPAGNFEKLRAALRFGADAVYLAGRDFGMRSAADNFTDAELDEAITFTHERGKKVYLTVNTMPHVDEYPRLRQFLGDLRHNPPDGVILTDLGVLATVRELLPDTAVHISTQSSIVSPAAARAWADLGASRLVLARELTLDEIKRIREALPPRVSLEAFVHGSMCVSYSGRCMLSNLLTGRDGNRGQCAQPCRWNYTLMEEKRPDERIPVVENARGTFIMSSKDLCMLRHIPELIGAGVEAFKIEGRVKSAYYAAVITNAYRMVIDGYLSDPAGFVFDESVYREVESVSHREYDTGFFFSPPNEDPKLCREVGYIREKAYFATVIARGAAPAGVEAENEHGILCRLRQRNKLSRGEGAELLTPGRVGIPLTIDELYDTEGNPIPATPHPQMEFYTRLPRVVGEGDILREGEKT